MWGGARVVIISSICSVFDEVNRGDCIGAWEENYKKMAGKLKVHLKGKDLPEVDG